MITPKFLTHVGMAATAFVLSTGCAPAQTPTTLPPAAQTVPVSTKSTDSTIRTGQSAFGGYTSDAPGVRRHLTVADLPAPYATPSVDGGSDTVPRPDGAMPKAPAGFTVQLFASDLHNPRKIITAPNGDLFIAESGANDVRVIRPGEHGGAPTENDVFVDGLSQPFGLAFYPNGANPKYLYVGNTDTVVRFAYHNGDLKATGSAEMIVPDIPGGGRLRGGGHWTRDVVFTKDNKTMLVSVGSHSNVSDDADEYHRADILAYTPEGKDFSVYASGIRNPVGLAIDPKTGILWTSVNERDGLGDNLVPDYITHVTQGGFYGWPWYYMGSHQDPRHQGKHPELSGHVLVPDVLIQPHSASLAMTFYEASQFPKSYQGGAFASEHGSWNRSLRTGYKVIFVPIKNGKSSGEYDDLLTGFLTPDGQIWGRPVGVTVGNDGSLYVTDDGSNSIWRVTYTGTTESKTAQR